LPWLSIGQTRKKFIVQGTGYYFNIFLLFL
jgi:hypothetical protein